MNRRNLLVSATIAFSPLLAGCAGAGEEYEECDQIEIKYEWLPPDIKHEVDTALEDGHYETDWLLLSQAIDTEHAYIVVDDTPYKPSVDSQDSSTILELQEVDSIRLPEPRTITVENNADREHEIEVVLEGSERFIDETIALAPDEERVLDATEKFGFYGLKARTLTGHEDTDTFAFRVDDEYRDGFLSIRKSDINFTQMKSDLPPCPWHTE